MMLVSSSGWAHSPMTLIFVSAGAVYVFATAALAAASGAGVGGGSAAWAGPPVPTARLSVTAAAESMATVLRYRFIAGLLGVRTALLPDGALEHSCDEVALEEEVEHDDRRATMTAPAASRVNPWVYWPWKKASPSGAVRSDSSVTMTSGMRNSFQVHMKTSTTRVTTPAGPAAPAPARGCGGSRRRRARAASTSARLLGGSRPASRRCRRPPTARPAAAPPPRACRSGRWRAGRRRAARRRPRSAS